MTLFSYTLICLIVWRITYMLVEEDGPYIFKLRAIFLKEYLPRMFLLYFGMGGNTGVSLQLSIVVTISSAIDIY